MFTSNRLGRERPLICAAILAVLLSALAPVACQLVQFLPNEVPANIRSRLVFRLQDLADAWQDPNVRVAVLQEDLIIDEAAWRGLFALTGGVAAVGPSLGNGQPNFTISGVRGCTDASCLDATGATPLSAGPMSINFNKMPNAFLVGANGTLYIQDTTLYYTAAADSYQYSPAQPYSSVVLGADTWPTFAVAPGATLVLTNVTVAYRNPTPENSCAQRVDMALSAMRQLQPNVNMVLDNSTAGRIPGRMEYEAIVKNGSGGNITLGKARHIWQNVTFSCLSAEAQQATLSASLTPGQLAAAVAVPVCVALGGLAAWLVFKCRKSKTRTVGKTDKDVENCGDMQVSLDHKRSSTDSKDAATAVGSLVLASRRASSSGTVAPAPGSASNRQSQDSSRHGDDRQPAELQFFPVSGSHRVHWAPGAGAEAAGPSQPLQLQQSLVLSQQSSGPEPVSSTNTNAAIALAVTESYPDSGPHAYLRSSGHGESDDPNSGSFAMTACGPVSREGPSSRASVDPIRGVPALLKARSDMAVLRDLKIGPLLGRGSYGRVYKGRWKSVTVAVKIIEHHDGSTSNSSAVRQVKVDRETLLATAVAHPNVVQTYHVSTMTASQRNALANTWLSVDKQSSRHGIISHSNSSLPARTEATEGSTAASLSCDEDAGDPLETWMLMEFCERGSLERAITRRKFLDSTGKPNMNGIYKALLDTASGLDYLHSIGVVHGDLKTANVLLKGSTRDVRGFACKITDFGLSRVLDLDATHISTRTYGTITYMPAELLLEGRMTQATDVYSFGLMMWELYTSSSLFEEGMSIGQMFYMIAYQGWRPDIPQGCPAGYADLMQACWHQDPEQRPTAQRVLRSLKKLYLAHRQAGAAAATAALPPQPPASSTAVADAAVLIEQGTAPPTIAQQHAAAEAHAAAAAVGTVGPPQRWYPVQLQPGARTSFDLAPGPASARTSLDSQAVPKYGSPTLGSADKPEFSSASNVCVTTEGNAYQTWAEAVMQDQQEEPVSTSRQHSCNPPTTQALAVAVQQQPGRPSISEIQPADSRDDAPPDILLRAAVPAHIMLNMNSSTGTDTSTGLGSCWTSRAEPVVGASALVPTPLQAQRQVKSGQPEAEHGAAAAAQGYLEALDLVTQINAAAAASAPARFQAGGRFQVPFHYQQRPILPAAGQPGQTGLTQSAATGAASRTASMLGIPAGPARAVGVLPLPDNTTRPVASAAVGSQYPAGDAMHGRAFKTSSPGL